jgi:hypothetical protein
MLLALVSYVLLVAAVVAFLFLTRTRGAKNDDSEPWPFYAKEPLSNPEQVLYFRLAEARLYAVSCS